MPQSSDKSFTHSHEICEDGSVAFRCSDDAALWPWLALPPLDPVVLQTIHFWASVETGAVAGTLDTSKWTALTYLQWECGAADVGQPVRGLATNLHDDEVNMQMTFFDAADALVYEMCGKGVVFQTRDFEAWRANAKAALGRKDAAADFTYAPAAAAGLAEQAHVYISPFLGGANPKAQAVITRENGFPPVQPFMSGSGDHVNATHLGDVTRQFAQLVKGGAPLVIMGGEMAFKNYIELDHIFDIEQTRHDANAGQIAMIIKQAGKTCAEVKLTYLEQE